MKHDDRGGSSTTALRVTISVLTLAVAVAALGADAAAPSRPASFPAKAVELVRDGSPDLTARRLAGDPAPPRLDAVVLMCDFSDSLMYGRHGSVPGDFPEPMQTEFYYAAHDSTYFAHLFDDVRRYFREVSGASFEFDADVRPETANLPEPMVFYGNHPEHGEQKFRLAADVVAAFDDAVDFSLYDTVVLVHAGAGEETDVLGDSPEQIYSGYLSPEDFEDAVDEGLLDQPWIAATDASGGEVRLNQILVLPETEYQDEASSAGGAFGSLGVYCFEVGLRLGMLSLSDFTPSGYPDSQGIGQFGLMGYGLFAAGGLIPTAPCAYNRMLMGWIDPVEVDPDQDQTVTLWPRGTVGMTTLARVPVGPSEFWLLEYRLQDPSGDMIFSWGNDLNGDGIPNFTQRADSTWRPPLYGAPFDPELHVHETLAGSEWDFFMSDNDARPDGVKGAGSGLFIWHVDEGVIRTALQSRGNVFNADPLRKSVDVEEADGLQDLDRRVPSFWWLGADDDSFRAEGTARFGPETEPATHSAGGAWTGVVIDEITSVVADSTATASDGATVVGYASTMSFRCRRESAAPGAPDRTADLDLDGVDLAGSHLVAADLDLPPDGDLEIVAAGAEGRVFVWNHDLTPWRISGPVPGLIAVGTDAEGEPVVWRGPPLLTDLDGDDRPEIVLNGGGFPYVFDAEGGEFVDGDGDPLTNGLAYRPFDTPMQGMTHAPVKADTGLLMLFQDTELEDPSLLLGVLDVVAGTVTYVADGIPDVPGFRRAGPPFLWDGDVAFTGVAVDGPFLWRDGAFTTLPSAAADWPPLVLDDDLLVPLADGGGVRIDAGGATAWDNDRPLRTPLAPGVAYGTDGGFCRTGRGGGMVAAWPAWPEVTVRTAEADLAAEPLSWENGGRVWTLFTSRDGRLYCFDEDGAPAGESWPLAGPGESAGTPLLADLDGVPGLELVAVGAAALLTGPDTGEGPTLTPRSALTVWSLPGTEDAEVLWGMWGGGPERRRNAATDPHVAVGGSLVVDGSLTVYPTPARGDRIVVRAVLDADGELRATLYNLEGEIVAEGAPAAAPAGEPCEVVLDVGRAVSGPYLCRIEAAAGARREVTVAPAAIER